MNEESNTKRILLVCTGNICRSPLAAALLERALVERGIQGIAVASAGTGAWDGAPVSEGAYLVGLERGLDLSSHRARLLTRELVDGADLILTMARHHRARVDELGGEGHASVLGLDAVYVALRTSAQELTTVLAALAAVGGAGNVTVPHKEAAERYVARKTDVCARVGACNTFWTEHGALVGDNTDVAGILAALRQLGADGAGSWLLLGTGGSARAVAVAAAAAKAEDRKSTRLNSSHGYISYAVFCLKKKKIIQH